MTILSVQLPETQMAYEMLEQYFLKNHRSFMRLVVVGR